jgi:FMN-dependent NADH-azoreductase
MDSLLHIAGSPNRQHSRTKAVATRFIQTYLQARPAAQARDLDIWAMDLPHFDEEMIAAKFAVLRATSATPAQQALWNRAVEVSRSFNRADLYVFSVPMWNFGVPYRFKHFMDIATLPGQNWRWTKHEGYVPLLYGKKAVVVYSSAGDYPLETIDPHDHVKPHVRRWLQFLGITDVFELNVAPTLADPAHVDRTLQHTIDDAQALAQRLAGAP